MSVTVTLIRLPESEIDIGKLSHKELEEKLKYPYPFPSIWFDSSREFIDYFHRKCKISFPWGNAYTILEGQHTINDNMESCYETPICYFKKKEISIIAKTLPSHFNAENISLLWNDNEIKEYLDIPYTTYTKEIIIGKLQILMDFFNSASRDNECILSIWG